MATTTESLLSLTTLFDNSTADAAVNCAIFDGDESKCSALVIVKRIVASFSLLGCIFMIGLIWLFKKYVVFTQRLILYMTIAAFFNSIVFIIADMYEAGSFCTFQAWAQTFFNWSVLMWVSCITFNLFMNAVMQIVTEKQNVERLYHFVCWGVSLFFSLIPFINNHYGPAGVWCWIDDDTAWRFGLWYAPLFLLILAMFIAYGIITYTINRQVRTWEGLYDPDTEQKKKALKEDVKPLKWYPLVYLILYIFPVINRIQNAAVPHNPSFALMLLHVMSSPLEGAVNAVVYGLDKETKSKLSWTQLKLQFQGRMNSEASAIRDYPMSIDVPPSIPYDTTTEPL